MSNLVCHLVIHTQQSFNCLVRTSPTLGPHECSSFRIGKMVIPTAHECSRSAQFSCRKSREKTEVACMRKHVGGIQKLPSTPSHIYFLTGNFRNSSPKNCRKAGAGVYRCSRVKRPSFVFTKHHPKKLFMAPCFIFYIFYVSILFIMYSHHNTHLQATLSIIFCINLPHTLHSLSFKNILHTLIQKHFTHTHSKTFYTHSFKNIFPPPHSFSMWVIPNFLWCLIQ